MSPAASASGRRRRWRAATFGAVTLVALPGGRAASGPVQQPPSFEAATSVVAVPVFVLDGSGRPVADLGAEDFEVLDRGRVRPIVFFQSIDAQAAVTRAGRAPPGPLAVQAASQRQFLFLFDVTFARPKALLRARQAAAKIVEEKLGPRDLVAVATSSTSHGLKLLVGFTSDHDQIVRAVRTLGVSRKPDPTDPLGLTFEPASGHPVAGGWDAEANEADQDEALSSPPPELHEFHVQRFLENLKEVARAVGEVQGHKQVVLFSHGFKDRTLVGARSAAGAFVTGGVQSVRSDDAFGSAPIRKALADAIQGFGASDAVVHVVDVGGLEEPTNFRRPGPPSPDERRSQRQESLITIASRSGGRIVKDTNDLVLGLGEVVDTSRHFYLLAFEPELSGKVGRHHEITVRVRRKGLRVLHRKSYLEATPERGPLRATSRPEVAEILAKGITGGELRVDALALPFREADGRLSVPLVLEVDAATLHWDDAPGGPALEIYVYTFDDRGRVVDLAAATSTPRLSEQVATIRKDGFRASTVLRVDPGDHDVRFLVREARTGRYGAGRLAVSVPAFGPGQAVLHPPLFMDGGAHVFAVPSRAHPRPESPFRVGEESFLPRTRPRLVNGRTQAVCVMFAPGRTDYPPGATFDLKTRLLTTRGGRLSPGPVVLARATSDADGFRRFKLELTPRGVPSGEYVLEVEVRDPVSEAVSRSQQPVTVE